MYELRQKLAGISEGILKHKFGVSTTVHFDIPLDEGKGDLTTSIALQLSKQLRKAPQDIALALVEGLKGNEEIESVEVAGAGYVNIQLTPSALLTELRSVREACTPTPPRKGENPVLIDYSAPNIAKPLGIHHILSTVIGQALKNLHQHLGYNVIGINYIGDFGTQFGKLAVAAKLWGKKPVTECTVEELLELYVRFHNEAEKNPSLEEDARAVFQALEAGDAKWERFLQDVVRVTMGDVNRLYERLHVSLDVVRGESYYRKATGSILEEGKKKKVFVEGEGGALIVRFPEQLTLPPAVIQKGDGATVYLTRDLAAVRDRIDTWHPQAILYVVDVSQMLHLRQVFASCDLLGWELPKLEHVVFGHMRFADRSMSTRKGNILRLQEVLDEAVRRADAVIAEHEEGIQTDNRAGLAEMMGIGAVVYGILSQNRKMDVVFDWKKVLSLEGNSAPYLQYTHARARSVLRKAEEKSETLPKSAKTLTDRERALGVMLLAFPEALRSACDQRFPHTLTNYLYRLCQTFNAFYNVEPILKAPKTSRVLRLSLTSLTAHVLKTGAELLTLRVPDRM